MKILRNTVTASVLAGALSVGTVAVPAHAAGKGGSGTTADTATFTSEQTSSAAAEVEQDSRKVARPHETTYYSGTNVSYVGQSAETHNTTMTESDNDLRVKNTTKQKISNSVKVTQATVKAMPHSTLYYYGTNISYVDQTAENTSTTVTKTHGSLKLKNTVKQTASNIAEVEQGTVKALPHSTVYYEGVNESYIRQHAENTDTTVTESGSTLDSKETVVQETSNTADVQQGVVKEFRHSAVHDNGSNTSVVVQSEDNTDN